MNLALLACLVVLPATTVAFHLRITLDVDVPDVNLNIAAASVNDDGNCVDDAEWVVMVDGQNINCNTFEAYSSAFGNGHSNTCGRPLGYDSAIYGRNGKTASEACCVCKDHERKKNGGMCLNELSVEQHNIFTENMCNNYRSWYKDDFCAAVEYAYAANLTEPECYGEHYEWYTKGACIINQHDEDGVDISADMRIKKAEDCNGNWRSTACFIKEHYLISKEEKDCDPNKNIGDMDDLVWMTGGRCIVALENVDQTPPTLLVASGNSRSECALTWWPGYAM